MKILNHHRIRIAALAVVLAGVLWLSACAAKARPGTVAAALCSPDRAQSLLDSRTLSREPLVQQLRIGGTVLLQDSETGIYYYSLPRGVSAGTLTLEAQGAAGVQLAVVRQAEGQVLPEGGTAELLAYTDTQVQSLTLVCTTLPLMSLQTEENADDIAQETDTPVSMTLYDNRENAGAAVVTGAGTIHVRGRGSSNYPKKGYRLCLAQSDGSENDMALLGLRADGDWILYADYAETDKVRQVFSARIWKDGCAGQNEFGADNANDYKFLELFLNGRYWGLYALGYPIDAKQLGIAEGEYSYFKDDPLVWETGVDYTEAGEVPGYELAEGGEDGNAPDEAWQALRDYYQTLLYAPWEERESLYRSADMTNAVDMWLYLDLIQGRDQVLDQERLYNVYITSKKTEESAKMLFTPWDFDRTWGTGLGDNNETVMIYTPADHVTMVLNPAYRLMLYEEDAVFALVKSRWQELRQGGWSTENVMALLDSYEGDVFGSGAYGRDYERWPESGHNDGQTDLSDFRDYVLERFAEMDRYIETLPESLQY